MSASSQFSAAELEAYLDESLAPEEMSAIETALRDDSALARRLAAVISRRDAGVHSLGAIWRRHRLTCPSREQLGSYLLGVLSQDDADYIRWHVERLGCCLCRASVDDLRQHQAAAQAADGQTEQRRRRYFQSSAGYLKRGRG